MKSISPNCARALENNVSKHNGNSQRARREKVREHRFRVSQREGAKCVSQRSTDLCLEGETLNTDIEISRLIYSEGRRGR